MTDPIVGVGLKVAPLAANKLKEFLTRDATRNLNRLVRRELETDDNLAPGIRDRLAEEWEEVRRDPQVAAITKRLLETGEPAAGPLLDGRIRALLSDLDMPIQTAEAAERIKRAVLRNLNAAQP